MLKRFFRVAAHAHTRASVVSILETNFQLVVYKNFRTYSRKLNREII